MSIIAHYKEDIKSELSNTSIETKFQGDMFISLYLTDYKQTKEAAKIITDIDNILALDSDCSEYDSHTQDGPLNIEDYLKSNDNEKTDDWKGDDDYRIGRINTTTKELRITQEKVNALLEKAIADIIKNKNATYYSLPDELLYKHPTNNIKITSINNVAVDNDAFTIMYSDSSEKYCTCYFHLCKEYKDKYNIDENFSKLLTLLGGTYKEKNSTATWTIGKNVWKAKINKNEYGNSKNFEIKKNDQKIMLKSILIDGNHEYISGSFDLEELEEMLDVEVKIDQVKMTATINKKE